MSKPAPKPKTAAKEREELVPAAPERVIKRRRRSADLDTEIVPGSLAERVSNQLKARNLTAKELSLRAGLSGDAVRAILRGRVEAPRSTTLAQVAAALGLTVDELAGGAIAIPDAVRAAAVASGDAQEVDVPEVDLRARGDADLPADPRSVLRRRTWRIPLDLLDEQGISAASLVIVRVHPGGVSDYAATDRLLVDTSSRRALGGVYIVHDGHQHSLAQVRTGHVPRSGTMSWPGIDGELHAEEIIGRVVGRWSWS
jgi:transcriptional regulator with XRE-family HTH domain